MTSQQFVDSIPDISQEEREVLYTFSLPILQYAHKASLNCTNRSFVGKYLITVATRKAESQVVAAPQLRSTPRGLGICPITNVPSSAGSRCCPMAQERHKAKFEANV